MRAANAGVRAPRRVFSMRGLAACAASSLRTGNLVMGGAQGLCTRGVAVNLSQLDGRFAFEINRVALPRAGLRASYHLRARARLVDGP